MKNRERYCVHLDFQNNNSKLFVNGDEEQVEVTIDSDEPIEFGEKEMLYHVYGDKFSILLTDILLQENKKYLATSKVVSKYNTDNYLYRGVCDGVWFMERGSTGDIEYHESTRPIERSPIKEEPQKNRFFIDVGDFEQPPIKPVESICDEKVTNKIASLTRVLQLKGLDYKVRGAAEVKLKSLIKQL